LPWHDLVAQVAKYQCAALEAHALMDFYQNFKPHMLTPTEPYPEVSQRVLGTFTTVPTIVSQLYAAGVPVWLIRWEEVVPADITIRNVI
ncbi:hypothetical protein HYDPIDRAFT_47024, partial [Hydnomerulius pinastri MD-312]